MQRRYRNIRNEDVKTEQSPPFVTARAKAYPPIACETPALAGTEFPAFVPERGCQRLYDLMQRRRG
jgi:hypothetical protein